MRIMIFGDVASGKSTFANELGEITDTPVTHLDLLMDEMGRDNRVSIGDVIRDLADEDRWIIEGNAFTKDPFYRIERAETIYAFDFNPLRAFGGHVQRYARTKVGLERRIGSNDEQLQLPYFVPYIFKNFPPRKEAALQRAHELDKDVVIFNRKKQAAQYLAELATL